MRSNISNNLQLFEFGEFHLSRCRIPKYNQDLLNLIKLNKNRGSTVLVNELESWLRSTFKETNSRFISKEEFESDVPIIYAWEAGFWCKNLLKCDGNQHHIELFIHNPKYQSKSGPKIPYEYLVNDFEEVDSGIWACDNTVIFRFG